MSKEPLPRRVDPRKLAVVGQLISATQPVSSFPRFTSLLHREEGEVVVSLEFGRDQQGILVIEGSLETEVWVTCQRCLKPMRHKMNSQFHLGIVRDDEAAKQLPKALDPLIVEDDQLDLFEVVEDELIISLPFTSYHDERECESDYQSSQEPLADEEPVDEDNPFKVLEALKSSKPSNEEH